MLALNAPGSDAAPPDSVSRPCTSPGACTSSHGSSVPHRDAPDGAGHAARKARMSTWTPHAAASSAMRSTCSVVDESRYSSPRSARIIASGSAQQKAAGVRPDLRVRLWFFCAGEGVAYILGIG
jgi:hypothetical protein